MKLFKRRKWSGAYAPKPRMYEREDGILGVFALTEETDTVLPEKPMYQVDGKAVHNWRLLLVSTSDRCVLGEVEYFQALEHLKGVCCR